MAKRKTVTPVRDGTDAEMVEWFKQSRLRDGFGFDARLVPSSFDNLADLEDKYFGAENLAVRAARNVSKPVVTARSPDYMTKAMVEQRLDRAFVTVGKWVASVVKPLEKRIAELEQRQFKFIGAWVEGFEALPGNACSHEGSMWLATEKTMKRPGTENSGWLLAVKRGKDARSERSKA